MEEREILIYNIATVLQSFYLLCTAMIFFSSLLIICFKQVCNLFFTKIYKATQSWYNPSKGIYLISQWPNLSFLSLQLVNFLESFELQNDTQYICGTLCRLMLYFRSTRPLLFQRVMSLDVGDVLFLQFRMAEWVLSIHERKYLLKS